jgi:3' terminal RNA ribose 2'-O-methyltransferase Hen1
MLLTISTTHRPATDLGFLLYKHPDHVHTVNLAFGTATVAYPVATDERCTVALLMDVDQVELVRGRRDSSRAAVTLGQYVNDRPYAASSFLSTALAKVFGTAMTGRSKERPELAATAIPLEVHVAALPCRGGEAILRRLFEPLGYVVSAQPIPLDPTVTSWGMSQYFNVTLSGTHVVRDLLEHLYVLIPVLDNSKHYWVGDDEIERLLRRGGAWLASHPDKELISTRALRYDRRMTREALTRLTTLDSGGAEVDVDSVDTRADEAEQVVEERISLNEQRMAAVVDAVRESGARRVADMGCGEGRLIWQLLRLVPSVEKVVGVDVSMRSLQHAAKRLHLDTMAPSQRRRVDLFQGALTYRDKRLIGMDTVTLVEVIEHVDEPRLAALEGAVFESIGPRTVIVTTPNVEYNALFAGMDPRALRHRDHRFEWTRQQFLEWAVAVAQRHRYTVAVKPIGPVHEQLGPPTQMAVFTKSAGAT